MRVTNDIPLGCSLLLPVGTVNCVQTLKVMWGFDVRGLGLNNIVHLRMLLARTTVGLPPACV
jgi:hypothetical protein